MTIEIHQPELEALIQERMASGQFSSVEDVLWKALQPGTAQQSEPAAEEPKQNLAQFLMNSPLRGSGIVLERNKDYPRPIDL